MHTAAWTGIGLLALLVGSFGLVALFYLLGQLTRVIGRIPTYTFLVIALWGVSGLAYLIVE